jgi:phosphate:Na+ symporter
MQAGADVKTELLYMDVVRHIEKIGDGAFDLARALREMK